MKNRNRDMENRNRDMITETTIVLNPLSLSLFAGSGESYSSCHGLLDEVPERRSCRSRLLPQMVSLTSRHVM